MKYPFDVNESIEWLGMFFFCRNEFHIPQWLMIHSL
jgi:hypothetical protein